MAGDLAEAPGGSKLSAGHCCEYATSEDAERGNARLANGKDQNKLIEEE